MDETKSKASDLCNEALQITKISARMTRFDISDIDFIQRINKTPRLRSRSLSYLNWYDGLEAEVNADGFKINICGESAALTPPKEDPVSKSEESEPSVLSYIV